MALTKAVGSDANITFLSQHNFCCDMWELERGQRLIDTSCFGDAAESFRGGRQYGSFAAEGKPIYGAASTALGFDAISAAAASVTFTVATGCTIAVGVVVTNIRLRPVHGGESRVAFVGVTSGSVTVVWATS